MKTKTHIFCQNHWEPGEIKTWSYGRSKHLTAAAVEKVKRLLPADAKILIIDFVDPSEYHYPNSNIEETTND